jgi:hypothetical protein
MKRILMALLLLATLAAADEIPTSNPAEVWVKGRRIDHSWRDGRIWVSTTDMKALLNLDSEMPSMDLLKALEKRGDYLWTCEGGVFKAERDPSKYSVGASRPSRPSRQNASSSREASYGPSTGTLTPRSGPAYHLTYAVKQFVAEETGYARAWVKVENAGPGVSDPTAMLVEFQDTYHYAWAKEMKSVPPLAPGESKIFECFSMVPDDVKLVDGVQRTMSGDQVVCKFRSLVNPANDPSKDQQRKENRRGRKIEFHAPVATPLPTMRF